MRTLRILVATLGTAGLAFAGSQAGAVASQWTDTCTHGVAYNNSSHKRVEYLSSRNVEDAHIHKYKHVTLTGIGNHERERNC